MNEQSREGGVKSECIFVMGHRELQHSVRLLSSTHIFKYIALDTTL